MTTPIVEVIRGRLGSGKTTRIEDSVRMVLEAGARAHFFTPCAQTSGSNVMCALKREFGRSSLRLLVAEPLHKDLTAPNTGSMPKKWLKSMRGFRGTVQNGVHADLLAIDPAENLCYPVKSTDGWYLRQYKWLKELFWHAQRHTMNVSATQTTGFETDGLPSLDVSSRPVTILHGTSNSGKSTAAVRKAADWLKKNARGTVHHFSDNKWGSVLDRYTKELGTTAGLLGRVGLHSLTEPNVEEFVSSYRAYPGLAPSLVVVDSLNSLVRPSGSFTDAAISYGRYLDKLDTLSRHVEVVCTYTVHRGLFSW